MKKIVLFGCGGFAKKHIRELLKRDEVEVGYFVDPSDGNRRLLTDLYRRATGILSEEFGSLEEFLASNSEFDAAVIVTPPKSHFEIASAMIKLGKPVYVEKPFTVTVEEARELSRLSNEYKVKVEIGANRCVFPAYRAAAEAVGAGKIGDLQSILMYYSYNWERVTKNNWRQDPSEPASGILADHSAHYMHFLVTNLGFKPAKVRHLGTRFNEAGVDVDVCYSLINQDGKIAYVIFDGSPSGDNRKEIIKINGSDGTIIIKFEGDSSNAYIEKDGKEKKINIGHALEEIQALGIRDFKSHPALIHNFVGLLTGEVKINANPAQEGVLPVYLTELIEKSRGKSRGNSLTKVELAEISNMVDTAGHLDSGVIEKYFDRGTEVEVFG